MRQELFTVEHCFKVAEHGLVIIGEPQPDSPAVQIGSALVLIKSDATEKSVEAAGIELFKPISFPSRNIGILIKNLTKEDVPVGTNVYLEKAG